MNICEIDKIVEHLYLVFLWKIYFELPCLEISMSILNKF